MDLVFATLIFIAVIVVTMIFFGGWVVVMIVRTVARAFGGPRTAPVGRQVSYSPPPIQQLARCPQTRCMADNPAGARFCRRCGQAMEAGRAVRVRRVA
ncbi:MAG: hypothetical protein JWL69_4097 [Phycisphaerales bacterium]|jgi:hypothetical protein|nr:hypothetical protein [Phycisphaerales bacterium]MDB5358505.1 hypothetical protein [Phycisphaerales bacterium]